MNASTADELIGALDALRHTLLDGAGTIPVSSIDRLVNSLDGVERALNYQCSAIESNTRALDSLANTISSAARY